MKLNLLGLIYWFLPKIFSAADAVV